MNSVTLNTRGLDQLRKAFKENMPKIKVGILGSGRNATIGAAHEFGTSRLPIRSFLRVPLSENLDDEMEKSGAFDKDALARVVKEGSVKVYAEKIAAICLNIVQDAFATGGGGKWKKWKPGYINNTGQILVDTQQLRNSISTEVT